MKYENAQIEGEFTAWYAPCPVELDMTGHVEWDRTPFGRHTPTTPLEGRPDPLGRPREHKDCEGSVKPKKKIIVFKEGETKLLPREWDEAIQGTICHECRDRKMYCRNPEHRNKTVTRGLGMSLQRVEGFQPPLHPSLLPEQEQGAAVTHPARSTEHVTLDDRTLARAKAARAQK